ncbi:MAG: hypothetical protein H6623_01445 [Bdellovibrionaceae bacterium]|nr:hypothetical protein [Pseudobdellovibrionaceae bacterium]
MKLLFVLTLLASVTAQAHCPTEIQINQNAYCLAIKWQNAEQKVKGVLQTTPQSSPQLVAMQEIPLKWLYSSAAFVLWKKSDPSHQPQFLENFRIFPYMHMANGHHHSTGYQFEYDAISEHYVLHGMALMEMTGCWSLRWTLQQNEDEATSQLLVDITHFENLDNEQNATAASFCSSSPPPMNNGEHHHQH